MIEGLPAVQHVHFDRKFNRARRPRFSGVNVPVKLSRRTWRKCPTIVPPASLRAPALENSLRPFALGSLQHRRYPYTSSAIPIRPGRTHSRCPRTNVFSSEPSPVRSHKVDESIYRSTQRALRYGKVDFDNLVTLYCIFIQFHGH